MFCYFWEKSGVRPKRSRGSGSAGKESECVGVIFACGQFYSIILVFSSFFGSVYLYMGGAFFLDWDCVIGICGRISAFYGSSLV